MIDQYLNFPHRKFTSVHVAGTNGKGSVCYKIYKSLMLANYKVGLFTSPHISSYRERIIVNDVCISEEEVENEVKHILRIAKEINVPIVVHAGYGTDKDIVNILKQENVQDIGGQIHGYMSKKELVSELLDLGFYFSFGYYHSRDEELKKIVEITPIEQILTETDSPYHIIESPKRFILPEDITLITKHIANIKDTELKDFNKQVIKNAKNLFRF